MKQRIVITCKRKDDKSFQQKTVLKVANWDKVMDMMWFYMVIYAANVPEPSLNGRKFNWDRKKGFLDDDLDEKM